MKVRSALSTSSAVTDQWRAIALSGGKIVGAAPSFALTVTAVGNVPAVALTVTGE